ncbi:MAG: ArgE/DapE family deacylase [bacterium]
MKFASYINRDEALQLLTKLISIDSVNPSLVEGGAGEAEIAAFLENHLQEIGLKAERKEIAPGRMNVVGVWRGTGHGKSLMLNGHIDTVSAEGMVHPPFQASLKEGRVYGRGALDMKGGLTAILCAIKAVKKAGLKLRGDVVFAGVADEEYASIGTEAVVRDYRTDGAVICEPSNLDVIVAHKGFAWIKVDVRGKAAHGSLYQEGIDAISKAGKVLQAVDAYEKEKLHANSHPLVGSPSIHASLISGGKELSTYPDFCRIEYERRTIPGETEAQVRDEMKAILDRIAASDRSFQADSEVFFYRPPLEVPYEAAVVKSLHDAFTAATGKVPKYAGKSGWMDSAILQAAGVPTVVFGPGGRGSHAAEEYVELEDVLTTANVLAQMIADFCA